MSFPIVLRVKKLKNFGSVSASKKHNLREQQTPNADPKKLNDNEFIKGDELIEQRMKKIISDENITLRKNGVLAIETVITMNKNWFKNKSKEEQDIFFRDAMKWQEDHFGKENVITGIIHRDEQTPHMHTYILPIDDTERQRGQSKRLNCRRWLGGTQRMSDMQTLIAERMENSFDDIGRGRKKSKADHIDIQEYYTRVNEGAVKLVLPDFPVKKTLEDPEKYRERVKTTLEMQLLPPLENAIAQAQQFHIERQRNEEMKIELEEKTKKIQELEEVENWRRQNEELRDIPVVDVLEQIGAEQNPRDLTKWNYKGIEICISKNEPHLWNDFKNGKGGKGAINLVMFLTSCQFKEAVYNLQKLFGQTDDRLIRNIADREICKIKEEIRIKEKEYSPPVENIEHIGNVREYLIKQRGIDTEIIDILIKDKRITAERIDFEEMNPRINAVFHSPAGAEKRGIGTDSKFKGSHIGSRIMGAERGNFMIGKGSRLVICESAIDVLTYYQMNENKNDITCISTNGARAKLPKWIENNPQYTEICIAYDNDETGKKQAEKIIAAYPNMQISTEFPTLKDWNADMLKSRGDEMKNQFSKAIGILEELGELDNQEQTRTGARSRNDDDWNTR